MVRDALKISSATLAVSYCGNFLSGEEEETFPSSVIDSASCHVFRCLSTHSSRVFQRVNGVDYEEIHLKYEVAKWFRLLGPL